MVKGSTRSGGLRGIGAIMTRTHTRPMCDDAHPFLRRTNTSAASTADTNGSPVEHPMPRRLIRRLLPRPQAIREQRALRAVSARLHDANLWHLNRHSVSVAAFVGVFTALLPIPMQMLVAASGALWLRCNITIAVVLVWITNPLTMPPIFYLTYRIGAWLLGVPAHVPAFEFSVDWIRTSLGEIWLPLLLGSLVSAIVCATLAWAMVRVLWRIGVQLKWHARLQARRTPR